MKSTSLAHLYLHWNYTREARRFNETLRDPEAAQRRVLDRILRLQKETPWGQEQGLETTYDSFARRDVTTYADWAPVIENQRATRSLHLNRALVRYEPTSGSTSSRKWIPYTPDFLNEMNLSAAAWLGELYLKFPAIGRGRHYWSLSWVPEDLRGEVDSDDSQLFPPRQRRALSRVLGFHPAIARAPSASAAWTATLLYLGSLQDLTFVSVWSPTYLLRALNDLYSQRKLWASLLRWESWGEWSADLGSFPALCRTDFPIDDDFATFARKLWPRIALVSCWDSSTSLDYANELRALLPHAQFQGKGLWATEGVVTIPFGGSTPLALNSHFLEFRDLANGEVLPSWRLEPGRIVQPLLTTSSGLLRYALADRLEVGAKLAATPALRFLGRAGGIDLVGEKIEFALAESLLADLPHTGESRLLVAHRGRRGPAYVLALRGRLDRPSRERLTEALEQRLLDQHHYRVARELGQLQRAFLLEVPDHETWRRLSQRSAIFGQNKPEVLVEENLDDFLSAGL